MSTHSNQYPDTTFSSYAAYTAKHSEIVEIEKVPWVKERGVLRPLSMPHMIPPIDPGRIRSALKKTHSLLALWNDAWDTEPCSWWWVCADDRSYDIQHLKKKIRYYIRKGTGNCTVRRLEPRWFAENGYGVYKSSFQRYTIAPPLPSAAIFEQHVLAESFYPGWETWGAFLENTLIAYGTCFVIDNAVKFAWAKSDPEYLSFCPNYALYYTLTRHYLRDRNVQYVTDGARVLLHKTNIQDFLERMGYRRIYCPLRIVATKTVKRLAKIQLGRAERYLRRFPGLKGLWWRWDILRTLFRIADDCENCIPKT